MEDNKFDKKVADYLNHRKMEVSPDAWQKLATELPLQPKSNKRYWNATVAAVLVLGLAWMLKQDTENIPITVVEPSTEINVNPIHSVLSDEVKPTERKNSNTTSSSMLPITAHTEKKWKPNLIKPTTNIEVIPMSMEKQTDDLVIAEVKESSETKEIQEINSDELAQTDLVLTDLVLKNLELPKTQFKIDPDELLKLAESEIKKEKNKRFREKVIDKAKETMNNLNIALK